MLRMPQSGSSAFPRKHMLLAVVLQCTATICATRTMLLADLSVYPGASPADQAKQAEARLTKAPAWPWSCAA